MDRIFKPTYLIPELGELGVLPNNAIINAGGVEGPNFLVGGKALVFADGTATDGSGPVSGIGGVGGLQGTYNASGIPANIDLVAGKDIIFTAINNKTFTFSADTGTVRITGDLIVDGSQSSVIDVAIDTDKVNITQKDAAVVPFKMEPLPGLIPVNNIIDVKAVYGGPSVFTVSATGITTLQTLNVTGLINGVDLDQLKSDVDLLRSDFNTHIDLVDAVIKHTADQVSIDTSALQNITGVNVREAIESIDQKLASATASPLEYIQSAPIRTWTIVHGRNSKRVQMSVWDLGDELVFADYVKLIDNNTVEVAFSTPQSGRAVLMIF